MMTRQTTRLLALLLTLAVAGCGGLEPDDPSAPGGKGDDDGVTADTLRGSLCLACHAERTDLVGPSFVRIAQRYAAEADAAATLADRVVRGVASSSATWGTLPMLPNEIDARTAERLVGYVLSVSPVAVAVQGRVLGRDGAALTGASVTLSGRRSHSAMTASQGLFSVQDVEPGDYELTVRQGDRVHQQRVTVAVAPSWIEISVGW